MIKIHALIDDHLIEFLSRKFRSSRVRPVWQEVVRGTGVCNRSLSENIDVGVITSLALTRTKVKRSGDGDVLELPMQAKLRARYASE